MMADEKTTTPGTTSQQAAEPSVPPAGAQNTETAPGAKGEERTVPYQRFQEINDRLKAAEKRAADLDTADKKRQREALSEVDRIKAEAAEWQEKATKAAGKVRELALRQSFRSEADKAKLRFTNDQAAVDAFTLLDMAGVTINDDGEIAGMDKAIKELAKSRPYLFAAPQQTNIDASAGGKPGGPTPQDAAAKLQELKQRFRFQ